MNDKQDESPVKSPLGILGTLHSTYGSWAFGLVMLLAIWQWIVQPQLDSMKIDYEEHRKIVATMHDTASAMNATAKTMESTSHILERQTDMLEEILSHIDNRPEREP